MAGYVNRYGRRWGRGARPWLLLPKVVAVAVYLGGLVAATVLAWMPSPASLELWAYRLAMLRGMFINAIVPALVVAILTGFGLLLLHGRPVWRMRWLRVKLVLLALSLPALHVFSRTQMLLMREILGEADAAGAVAQPQLDDVMLRFRLGLVVAIVVALLAVLLGRHKPRLGQPIASHPRTQQSST